MSFLSRLGEALRNVLGDGVLGDRTADGDTSRNESALATETRVSRIIVRVATLWFVVAAAWELFGPALAGHYASSAGMGVIADNMHRWHILAPVWTYTETKPTPDLYYCHHPWGIFWTTRAFYEIFGRHDFVCRLPAVVLSGLTPPLLAALSRALYRPYAGAATAVGFVVLPITLSFACFNALEVPVIAYSALFLWGYVRVVQSPKRRYVIASVVGATLALNADWPAFVLVGAVLGAELLRTVAGLRGKSIELDRRRAQWWALTASAAVITFGLYLYLFLQAGKLQDFLGSYGMRSSGNQAPLAAVLFERRYWIELMFTPLAIAIGKGFAVVCALRLCVRRRMIDFVPLAVLAMATVQYVVFKEGADMHVFWPHYFAAYFALAVGGSVATVAALLRVVLAKWPRIRSRATLASLALFGVALALVFRDGAEVLVYAHATGGRFNEKGLRIQSDGDKIALLRWLAPKTTQVGLHESMDANWADVWALGGRPVPLSAAPPKALADTVTVVDARFVPDMTKTAWLKTYGVTAVGPFWILRADGSPSTVLSFAEREPSIFERYFISGTEPHRDIVPNTYAAWELFDNYGLPVDIPTVGATTLEEHRISYNIAIDAGDSERAAKERDLALAGFRPLGSAFSDGTKIVGARYDDGAAPKLVIVFEAAGPLAVGVEMSVTSRVVQRAFLSTTMPDPTKRELGYPFALAPTRFKAGFLYAQTVVVRPRPGIEVFEASFKGKGAPTIDHPVEVLRH